jgi:hypothetical protein
MSDLRVRLAAPKVTVKERKMAISDKNAKRGLRFICCVADNYEDTMDDNSSDAMNDEQRARLGMAFAAYANGVAIRDLGLVSGSIAIVRAVLAGRKMVRLLSNT